MWLALKRHWMLPGIALACFWGYRYPATGELISRHLAPMLALLMFLMGTGIGFRRFRTRINAHRQIIFVMSFSYLAAPLVAFGIGKLFFSEHLAAYTGLILIGTTSTTLSTCIVFTRLAGGDEALALWLSVCSSLICTFISPVLIYLFLGTSIEVPIGMMMRRLIFVLFIPLSAGMFLRALLGEKRVAPAGSILTRSCAIIILAVVMVSVAKGRDLLASWQSLPIILAVAGFHLFMLLTVTLANIFADFPKRDKIATLFCSAEKTLQIPAYLAIEILLTPQAALAPVLHHVFQLVIDSLVVSYYSSGAAAGGAPPEEPGA
jgi:predicted Na+-dependent transporter